MFDDHSFSWHEFFKQLFAVKNSIPFDAESNEKESNQMEKNESNEKKNRIFLPTIYLKRKISLLLTNYTHDRYIITKGVRGDISRYN